MLSFFGILLGERACPNYVRTYFIGCPTAEYATQKPDGNLTRLSPPESESGLRDYDGSILIVCSPAPSSLLRQLGTSGMSLKKVQAPSRLDMFIRLLIGMIVTACHRL